MSLYKKFKTDPVLEQEGVEYELIGEFRCRIRRAGGSNKRYGIAVDKALKPWRQVGKDLDKEDAKVRQDLWTQIFCEACYVEYSWETLVDGDYVKGIQLEDGTVVPATIKNVMCVLQDLPEIAQALRNEAAETDHYLQAVNRETIENLKE